MLNMSYKISLFAKKADLIKWVCTPMAAETADPLNPLQSEKLIRIFSESQTYHV